MKKPIEGDVGSLGDALSALTKLFGVRALRLVQDEPNEHRAAILEEILGLSRVLDTLLAMASELAARKR